MASLAECFEYLDDLRLTRRTNMWGARPFLQERFDLGEKEARKIHVQWMETFKAGTSPEHRASLAKE